MHTALLMKLHDYFEQYKHSGLEEQDKLLIYQAYLDKSHRVIHLHKVRYYTKMTSFALGLGLVAVLGYVLFQPPQQSGYQVAHVGDAIITMESRLGTVQADSLGEIVYANGDIKIYKDDQEVSDASELWHNDRVLLQPGAELEFTVRDGVAAKIIGPAEFAVEFIGEYDGVPEYGINLIAGDYLEVSSLPEANSQQVVIKTPEFQLENVHTNEDFNVVISTKDGKKTVENTGGELVIKKLVKENAEKVFVSLKTNQVVQINGDIALLSDEQAEEVVAQIKDQPLAIRYEVDAPASEEGESVADLLSSTALQDSKSVMDAETAADLARLLDRAQLASQADAASIYYFAGNTESFDIALTNLLSRITRSYNVLGLEVDSSVANTRSGTKSLAQGVILVDQLIAKMSDAYYVEPAYSTRLRSTLNWMMFLQSQSFGHYSESDEFDMAQLKTWLAEEGADVAALDIQ